MNQKGQTLIEVLVGLAVAVVVLSAITTATLSSLSNGEYGRQQDLANTYAQQGMEIIRNIQQTDYGTFSSLAGEYCFAQACDTISPLSGGACGKILGTSCPGTLNDGSFIRTVTFHGNDAEAAKCNDAGQTTNTKVDVTLSWNDAKCTDPTNLYCHNVTVASCFNNEGVVPTP